MESVGFPFNNLYFVIHTLNFTVVNSIITVVEDTIWPTDTDRYGRTVVTFIFVGGADLNKELMKAGLAWHYKRYSRDPELAKLEFEARAKKVGLWKEPDQIAPWEWRKNKRNKSG